MSNNPRTRRALERLGEARLTAFFRAIQDHDPPFCVELVNRQIDDGEPLEQVLLGDEGGFYVEVKGRGRRFRIDFGYAAMAVGDGGTWAVEFGPDGAVVRAELETMWIA